MFVACVCIESRKFCIKTISALALLSFKCMIGKGLLFAGREPIQMDFSMLLLCVCFGSIFIFVHGSVIIIIIQKKMKFEPSIKLNHNKYLRDNINGYISAHI